MTGTLSRRPASLIAAGLLVASVGLTMVAAVGWQPLDRLDRRLVTSAHDSIADHPSLVEAVRGLTYVGHPLVVTALTVVVALALWLTNRRRAAVYLLACRLLAVVLSDVTKAVVDRPRPPASLQLAHAAGSGFPSGHALGSAALWCSVALVLGGRLQPAVRVAVAVVVPLVVAATRVLLAVHYPTDALGGLLLGWAAALVVGGFLLADASVSPRVAADLR